jgi:hypothetical protein
VGGGDILTVDRERLKYLTRTAFVESKRRLVQDQILKWHTRLVSHDGTVYVTPRISNTSFSADNLLGLPSVNWLATIAAAMIRVDHAALFRTKLSTCRPGVVLIIGTLSRLSLISATNGSSREMAALESNRSISISQP